MRVAGDWLVAPTQTGMTLCSSGKRGGLEGAAGQAFLDLPTGISSGSEKV